MLFFQACGSAQTGSIGAVVGRQPDRRHFIRSVPRGMAGEKAGLEVDDELLAVDGKDVRGMSTEDLVNALRGDVGSSVVLTISRRGEKREIKVVRGPFAAAKGKT
jgi:carboxyl-terminal processing protease